ILHSGKTHPDREWVTHLRKAFSEKTSNEVLEDLLKSLSPEDRKLVQELRQEYSMTIDDEADALKHTDSNELWKTIADSLGFVQQITAEGVEELHKIFQQIDTDGSGEINVCELRNYINVIAPYITREQIEEMFEAADTSGDYLISYDELKAIFESLNSSCL
ncbi:MAG: EF-hand domain-containing protein, partial [Trichodesmium sp.]